jgi:hypothetical protein
MFKAPPFDKRYVKRRRGVKRFDKRIVEKAARLPERVRLERQLHPTGSGICFQP